MTTEKTPKTLAGEVADIAFRFDSNGNEFAEVSVFQKIGDKYAPKARAFSETLVEYLRGVRKGQQISLAIQERQVMLEGKPVTYRNIMGINGAEISLRKENPPDAPPLATPAVAPVSASGAPLARFATPEAPQTPTKREAGPGEYLDTLECPPLVMGADKYSAANERYIQWHMDRRTALMQATVLMKDHIDPTGDVLKEADELFAWLRGEA